MMLVWYVCFFFHVVVDDCGVVSYGAYCVTVRVPCGRLMPMLVVLGIMLLV